MDLPFMIQAHVQPMQMVTIPVSPELQQAWAQGWAVLLDMAADVKALRYLVTEIGERQMETNQRVDHLISVLGNIQTDIGEAKQQVQDLVALLKQPDLDLQAKVEQAIALAEQIDAGMEEIVIQPTEPPAEPTEPSA